MDKQDHDFALIVGGAVLLAALMLLGSPAKSSPSAPQPDLLSVFRLGANRADAIHDARTLAAFASEQARMLEMGQRPDAPVKLGTAGNVEDLRVVTLWFLRGADGKSYLGKYESHGPAGTRDEFAWTMGTFLQSLGDNGDAPLSPEQLCEWAGKYRQIAESASYAADHL